MKMNNLQDFDNYIESLCDDVWFNYKHDLNDQNDWPDIAHELADSSQYVIYYGMAWDLVTMMRHADSALFNDAEDSAFDHGIEFESANQMMTLIAYELIYQAIMLTLNDKFNKQEAA
jgi:hypothetical protein